MKTPQRITIRMPEKLRTSLESLAAADDRKMSHYLRKVLSDHVKNTRPAKGGVR